MAPASIVLSHAAAAALADAARSAWPMEMVGLLGGSVARWPGGEPSGEPVADVLHVQHFLRLPGASCARDHFVVPPARFAAGEAELRGMGSVWLGFAHSHPNGTATPSSRDRVELWRHCLQLIVGVTHGAAHERSVQLAAYWSSGGDFVPVPCGREAATVAP